MKKDIKKTTKKKIPKKTKVNLKGVQATKQKTVLHRYLGMVDNGGKRSLAEAGKGIYSKSYLESGKLQKTETWKALTDKFMPDSFLAEKNRQLLEKEEIIFKENLRGEIEAIHTGEIDVQSVKAGLDLAYRVKGKNQDSLVVKKPIEELTDAELAAMIKEEQKKFNKTD